MSFSGDIKRELCDLPVKSRCCALAELYGMLLFAGVFDSREIRIITKNALLPGRTSLLSGIALGSSAPEWEETPLKNGRVSLRLTQSRDIEKIYALFDYDPKRELALHLNRWHILDECCRAAFLRGAFLTGGYAAPPEKRYYLELSGTRAALMREISAFLSEYSLPPKFSKRNDEHVLYYKEAALIEAYLTLAGAHRAALTLMEARVIKDVRNKINREVNCETSNLLRAVESGGAQLEAIAKLKSAGVWEALDPELLSAAALRERFPEESLSALAEKSDPPVSRSGLNRRLQKLVALAEKLG